MNKHCCNEMDFHLKEKEVSIFYEERFRQYSIGTTNGTDSIQLIKFCPWCGAKLALSLKYEFFAILQNEFNLDISIFELDITPPEFKTDEWWRKRGL